MRCRGVIGCMGLRREGRRRSCGETAEEEAAAIGSCCFVVRHMTPVAVPFSSGDILGRSDRVPECNCAPRREVPPYSLRVNHLSSLSYADWPSVKYSKQMIYVQNIASKRVSPGKCPGAYLFSDLYIQYSWLNGTNMPTGCR